MKSSLFLFIYALMTMATLLVTGCDRVRAADGMVSNLTGKQCTIQFRRDALGAASNNPSSPLMGQHNGAQTSLSGRFQRFHEEWIVVDNNGSEYWIPRSTVLLVQFP